MFARNMLRIEVAFIGGKDFLTLGRIYKLLEALYHYRLSISYRCPHLHICAHGLTRMLNSPTSMNRHPSLSFLIDNDFTGYWTIPYTFCMLRRCCRAYHQTSPMALMIDPYAVRMTVSPDRLSYVENATGQLCMY